MPLSEEIDLLLIGKTGNGKSATGNSILMKENVFTSNLSRSSVTTTSQYEWSRFDDVVIQVVDTPGLTDTDSGACQDISLITRTMEDAMLTNPQGYHALLIVVEFCNRFTEEELKAIQMLKRIFGEDCIRDHVIIVMCYGDKFQRETQERGLTLEEYLNDESGLLKELLDECGNRILLFDNSTHDESEKYKQVKKLIDVVDRLSTGGKRYKDELLIKAAMKRKGVYFDSKLLANQKEAFKAQRLILDDIKSFFSERDENKKIQLLEKILARTDAFIENLNENDQNSKSMHDLLDNIKQIRVMVNKHIKLARTTIEDKSMFKVRKEKIEKEIEDIIDKEKGESEKQMTEKELQLHEKLKNLELTLQLMEKEEPEIKRRNLEKGFEEQMTNIERANKKSEEQIKSEAKKEMTIQLEAIEKERVESEKRQNENEEKLKRDFTVTEKQYRLIKEEADREFFIRSMIDVVYVVSDARGDEANGLCFVSYFRISVALSLVAFVVAIVAIAWIVYRHSYKNIFKTTITSADVVIYHQDKNTPKNYALMLGAHTVSALVRLFPAGRFHGTDHKEDPIFNPTSHSILELNEQATDNIHQHATGVNITREGIKILYPGLYFVYSSVNFKPNSTRFSADFHYQTWFQYISRRSATSPVLSGVLLRTVHTCCSNCTGSQETAYTGAVFHLQTGDLIQMSVSGQGLIEFSAGASYLGLYLLHDDV